MSTHISSDPNKNVVVVRKGSFNFTYEVFVNGYGLNIEAHKDLVFANHPALRSLPVPSQSSDVLPYAEHIAAKMNLSVFMAEFKGGFLYFGDKVYPR
ncbi:hypothetical protein [Vibrio crassostreae]|uniref:hypothetical protein n=1 Tax=Vibrio crassostreae TaxID=246167 RepID=UPI001B30BAAE|nr:hypothetical protein [Vibrio crassostreae]